MSEVSIRDQLLHVIKPHESIAISLGGNREIFLGSLPVLKSFPNAQSHPSQGSSDTWIPESNPAPHHAEQLSSL